MARASETTNDRSERAGDDEAAVRGGDQGAVGAAGREAYHLKTNFFAEVGAELRVLVATKPPAQAFTSVEQIGDGTPMAVASPAAIAQPQVTYRQAPWPRSGFEVHGGDHGVVGLKRGQDVAVGAVRAIGISLVGIPACGTSPVTCLNAGMGVAGGLIDKAFTGGSVTLRGMLVDGAFGATLGRATDAMGALSGHWVGKAVWEHNKAWLSYGASKTTE